MTDSLRARSSTVADAGHGALASRVGVDPAAVRVHTDDGVAESQGARAIARGADIHFAEGELEGPDAELLMGHELAHVVQQGEGSAVQAKRDGDTGHDALEAEADHVGHAVTRGETVAGTIAGRATHGSVQKFDSHEHVKIGVLGARDERGQARGVELAPGYWVDYGVVIALAGDFFGSMEELRAIAARPGRGAGTREEIDYIRAVKLPQPAADKKQAAWDEAWLSATFTPAAIHAVDQRYYRLAGNNASHFLNPEKGDAGRSTLDKANATHQVVENGRLRAVPSNAVGHYRANHLKAIGEALHAGKQHQRVDGAMAMNAFADHHLTDSFSAGHVRTARTSAAQHWNARVPMFFYNFKGFLAEQLANYINEHTFVAGLFSVDFIWHEVRDGIEKALAARGVPDLTFGDLVTGAVHDYDSKNGVAVTVEGMDRRLYGDEYLDKGDTLPLVTRAVQTSAADISEAHKVGARGGDHNDLYATIAPRGMFHAEEMIPVVKADAQVSPTDRSIKWDYPDIYGLFADARFLDAFKLLLKVKADELRKLGDAIGDADAKKGYEQRILSRISGDAGIRLVWDIIHWVPNTGGGFGRSMQDDNAYEYYLKARSIPSGLATLQPTQRTNLVLFLLEGSTDRSEQDAIFELLTSGGDAAALAVIAYNGWDLLSSKLGARFRDRYPAKRYRTK